MQVQLKKEKKKSRGEKQGEKEVKRKMKVKKLRLWRRIMMLRIHQRTNMRVIQGNKNTIRNEKDSGNEKTKMG